MRWPVFITTGVSFIVLLVCILSVVLRSIFGEDFRNAPNPSLMLIIEIAVLFIISAILCYIEDTHMHYVPDDRRSYEKLLVVKDNKVIHVGYSYFLPKWKKDIQIYTIIHRNRADGYDLRGNFIGYTHKTILEGLLENTRCIVPIEIIINFKTDDIIEYAQEIYEKIIIESKNCEIGKFIIDYFQYKVGINEKQTEELIISFIKGEITKEQLQTALLPFVDIKMEEALSGFKKYCFRVLSPQTESFTGTCSRTQEVVIE